MKEKKPIDRIFQERFKDFEQLPPASVWEGLEKDLTLRKKDRKRPPLWLRLSGAAALLILAFWLGRSLLGTEKTIPQVVEEPNQIEPTDKGQKTLEAASKKLQTPVLVEIETSNGKKPIREDRIPENKPILGGTPVKNKQNPAKNSLARQSSPKKNPSSIIKKHIENDQKSGLKNDAKVADNQNENIPSTQGKNITLSEIVSEKSTNKTDSSKENALVLQENKTETVPENATEDSIENALAQQDAGPDDKTDEPQKRWSIIPRVAPVYFNTLGQGSSLDGQFVNNPKTGDINISYGVGASYALNDRWQLRGGVHKLNVSYNTENVLAFQTNVPSGASPYRNIKMNTDEVLFLSHNTLSVQQVPESLNNLLNAQIKQELGFIEVPLEVSYKMVDKKVDLNLISGVSVLFLDDNKVFAHTNNGRRSIGEATNLNSTSYSANFGMGIDFNLGKSLNLSVDPMFKYQINTFKDTAGNFNPFVIGIYSGLNFKF